MSSASANPDLLPVGPYTPAQARVIETALALFAEHGIGGTSLGMIADAIGVTKGAIYHQYRTKDEIVLAVAKVVFGRMDAAVTAAEAEHDPARRREVLLAGLIEVAIERRREASVLQRDPVMLRSLEEHAPFERVMERMNRILMGGVTDPLARVRAAMTMSAIAGTVIHPLVIDLDDESLRSLLTTEVRSLPGAGLPMTPTARENPGSLADELEIRALVHRYADASSRRDASGVASTLCPDGQWHSPGIGKYHGRDAVVAFFTTMLEDWSAFLQSLLSGVVKFDDADPNHAQGRWFVEETGRRSEGATLVVSGVYHDEYVRDAGAWRIKCRRYDPLLIRADDSVTALPYPTDVPEMG